MESSNDVIEKSLLHDWVERETRALDVVASWEALCDTYRALEFADPISDTTRMEEFKWIIKEMNKHLTRARRQLIICRDIETAEEILEKMMSPAGLSLTGRADLAYHKLRQRWIVQMLAQLNLMKETMAEVELEGIQNGPNE